MSFKATLAANAVYRIGNVAVLFAITVVLSRAMGVEGYGMLSLLVLNATLFNLLTSFGVDSAAAYSAASEPANRDKVAGIILLVVLLQVLLLILVECICLAATGHSWLTTGPQNGWWLGSLFLFGLSLQEKTAALLNGSHLYTTCNKILFWSNLFAVSFFVFFPLIGKGDASLYLQLYIVLNLAQSLMLVAACKQRLGLWIDIQFSKQVWRPFFRYSFLVFVTNLVQFLAYRADLWLVDGFRSKTELGWYAVGVRLVQLFWILPVLFASIIFPNVSRDKTAYNNAEMLSVLRLLNTANIVAGVLLFFLVKPLTHFAFGPQYAPVVPAFQILLPGVILYANVTILAAYFAGMNAVKLNFWCSAFCLVSTVALDLLLIPRNGYIGAAIASSIGYSLTAFGYLVFYCRKQEVAFPQLFLLQKRDLIQLQAFGKTFLKRS